MPFIQSNRRIEKIVLFYKKNEGVFILVHDSFNATFNDISKFRFAAGHEHHWQLGPFTCRAYPDTVTGTSEDVLTSLSPEGPPTVRVCRESNTDFPIHSPVRYLYANAAWRSWRKQALHNIKVCIKIYACVTVNMSRDKNYTINIKSRDKILTTRGPGRHISLTRTPLAKQVGQKKKASVKLGQSALYIKAMK